jgi:hypothetical protein
MSGELPPLVSTVTSEIAVSIFLEDEDSSTEIEAAVRKVLKEAGLKVTAEFPPVLGSWFKRMIARAGDEISEAGLDEVADKALRALELEQLQLRQAEVNAKNMDAVANLIEKMDKISAAVIQIGSLLIVKSDAGLRVRELTLEEIRYLEANPSLRTNPAAADEAFGVRGQAQELTETAHTRALRTE